MINWRNQSVEETLIEACMHQNVFLVTKCVKDGADVSKVCSTGRTPLGIAAEIGNIEIIKALLKVEYTPEPENIAGHGSNLGYFVMVHSESEEKIPCSDKLCETDRPVKNGFNIDEFNDAIIQRIPGHSDANSTFQCADIMPDLEWDTEIDNDDDSFGLGSENDPWAENYLWYASILSQTGALLSDENFVNGVDGGDQFGITALHYAAAAGHNSAINILLEAGCKINVEDSDNFTPLHLAAAKDRTDVLELLLSKGANPHHRSTNGITPLHVSASWGNQNNVRSLIASGANVNAQDICDRTSLYMAVSRRQNAVVRLLIKKGAIVNMEEIHGYTPLVEAVFGRDLALVNVLLEAGSKVTQSHHLLHYAVRHEDKGMVNVLVKAGSIVNLRDEAGDTPLMLAVRTKSTGLVSSLLYNGAMVHLVNHVSRQTALLDAISCINSNCSAFSEIFSLLEKFGWNWREERNSLSYALMRNNDHAVVTLVRRWHIVTDEFLQGKYEMMNILLRRGKNFLVELFINAGFDLREFRYRNEKWLQVYAQNPLSLQQLTRISIRSFLKSHILQKLQTIHLPPLLKSYIVLEDVLCPCEV